MLMFKDIFPDKESVFIAEIGLNHNGNAATAEEMILKAAESGVDAVKFQTFIPEKMNSVYTSSLIAYGYEKEAINSEKNFFNRFILSKQDYLNLKKTASDSKIEFFSSPFDPESVDLLEDIGVRLYKVASSEVTNHILLKKIALTGKPVIMSTGISTIKEISMAVDLLKQNGTPDIILMHCVSMYPLKYESANLLRIASLKNEFGFKTGFSDHSGDILVSEIASMLGASVFERHFTLSREFECIDKDVSATPQEFKQLTETVKKIKSMMGNGEINYGDSEKEVARLARRSLFAKKKIPEGKQLSYEDVIPKRPGIGIPVYELDEIIGKKANREIKEDYLLKTEYFD